MSYVPKPRELLVLRSLANCKEQGPHSDLTREVLAWEVYFPVSCIIAVQPDTRWVSYDNSIRHYRKRDISKRGEGKTEVMLNPGDVVLWHGAHVHAGAAYQVENRRIFFKGISTARRLGNQGLADS
eukprot:8242592-Prorocentrum_lima.AAC.1